MTEDGGNFLSVLASEMFDREWHPLGTLEVNP
jgi:hypothetical protein